MLYRLWVPLPRNATGGNTRRGEVRGCGEDSNGLAAAAVKENIMLNTEGFL